MNNIQKEAEKREAINKFNIEKSIEGTEAYEINQDIIKGLGENEILEKARGGVYKDTAENRKKGRVGQKYGVSVNSDKKVEKQVSDKQLQPKIESLVNNPPEDFYEKVEKYFGEPEDDGESEAGLVKRILSHSKEKVEKFIKDVSTKVSVSPRDQIKEAPVGTIASGGGYSNWKKIGKNSWENSKTKTLTHNDGLMSRIGGFSDFKIHKSIENDIQKAEQTQVQKDKVAKVMKEFKEGKLKSSSGEVVTDRKQAIAIALSEAGLSSK